MSNKESTDSGIIINDNDYNLLHGWMTKLKLNDNGKVRNIYPNEMLIFSKLYGFFQDGKDICKCNPGEEYLAKWSNTCRKTVFNSLKILAQNGLIEIKLQPKNKDNKSEYQHNQYILKIEKIKNIISSIDDSNSLVKNTSAICIPANVLKFIQDKNLKTASLIIYSLINHYSSDGSFFTGSKNYMQEWCANVTSKTINNSINELKENNYIDFADVKNKKYKCIYWTTDSRQQNNGKFYPRDNQQSENFTHGNGKFYPRKEKKLLTETENFTHINSSEFKDINLNKEEVVQKQVSDNTTTTFSFEKYFNNTVLENLPRESSFQKRFIIWFNAHKNIDQEKLEAYLNFSVEKFNKKENQSAGLFITMFFSESDYDFFSRQYDKKIEQEKAEQERIKNNTVICPVCGKAFIKHNGMGGCSNCGLKETDLANPSIISQTKEYYFASDEEKAELDNKYKKQFDEIFSSFSKYKKPEPKPEQNEQTSVSVQIKIKDIYLAEANQIKAKYMDNGLTEQGAISKAQAELFAKYGTKLIENA